jgi:hypothetical protein
VIFKPGTGQAGQAKTFYRPGRPPVCDAFKDFLIKYFIFWAENVVIEQ